MIHSVVRYWHTMRHLRPVQVYGRVVHRLVRPRVDASPPPPRRPLRVCRWVTPAASPASMTGPSRFSFLSVERDLDVHGWDDPAVEKLWRYNLHYFADLPAAGAAERSDWQGALIERWINENQPGTGSGWEPFPTSLRIVNWVKWALAGNALAPRWEASLAVQARWLSGRLERHLLGNHLFANAKALVFAGAWFGGREGDAWLELGARIIVDELPEQILPDGGHFERSTMYHALALEDMLDLVNIGRCAAAPQSPLVKAAFAGVDARIPALGRWLAAMSHPDGEIAFFNDAAFGIAPSPETLAQYAVRLGYALPRAKAGMDALRDSGYVRLEAGGTVLLLDVAPVGPSYLPAHAHADTLSFEMSVAGQRLFVNSGTSRYGMGEERQRERGTAAHNTVVINDEDSSEVWAGFRVARRAKPLDLQVHEGTPMSVSCSHDGYSRLPGHPVHRRTWTLDARTLRVDDRITGTFRDAELRLHLHPAARVEGGRPSADTVVVRLPDATRVTVTCEGAVLRAEPSTWHPEFGATVPATCLAARFTGAFLRTHVCWTSR